MSRIDVHHHVHPDILKALNEGSPLPDVDTILLQDQKVSRELGIKRAILTATSPGLEYAGPQEAATAARRLNEFCASLRDRNADCYGFFATVPSPEHTQECILEIAYALDVLQADGITLLTRYGSGLQYLGHSDFAPMWQELDRRRAVVFVHPTFCVDRSLFNPSIPQPAFDFLHETGRTALDLIVSNTLRDHASHTKIILSHAGGSLASLVERAVTLMSFSGYGAKSVEQMLEEAYWFYFDTALSGTVGQMAALQQLARPGHVLYGSDLPNAPISAIKHFKQLLDDSEMLDEAHKRIINGSAQSMLFQPPTDDRSCQVDGELE